MSASESESFVMADAPSLTGAHDQADDSDEVDSLPSISTSILSDSRDSDAQREWEASLEQLQLLLTMVLVPFAGKYLGRKFAYWSWARYMEWMHNVDIVWTSKTSFKTAGAAEAAASL